MIWNYYLFNALSPRRNTLYFYKDIKEILHWETVNCFCHGAGGVKQSSIPLLSDKAETYSIIKGFFLCNGRFLCKMEYYHISLIENIGKRTAVNIVFIHEKLTQVLYTSFTKKLTIFYLYLYCAPH